MFEAHITNQRLTLFHPRPVADSINYLAFRFYFTPDWDGLDKWAHFEKDGTVCDIPLTDDEIRPEDGLNLTEGTWNLSLHGDGYRDGTVVRRITTDRKSFTVEPAGTVDGQPFEKIIPSAAEQILARLTELEKKPDPVTLSEVREETAKNHYTKTETDAALAGKAPELLQVFNEYGVTDYSSDEIRSHIASGGVTTLTDVDIGEFPFLWAYAKKVCYGGIIPILDTFVYVVFIVSENTASRYDFSMADYAKAADVVMIAKSLSDKFDEHYTKSEINAIMGSYVTDIANLIGGEANADS